MTSARPGDPLDELPLSERKQQFSLAFVQMVAAAAGCYLKDHRADYDGVDITVAASADYDTYFCPQFEFQLKCTSQADIVREQDVVWRMEAGPFRRLTNPKRYLPAYLGVLVVPLDPDAWLVQDETRLITGSRLYWERATNLGDISDGAATTTVHLPRSNLFDVAQLRDIMKTIGDGGGI